MSESGVSDIERLWNWIYRSTQNRLQIKSFEFRVVLCRIRLFPTLIWKIKWLGSGVPLNLKVTGQSKIRFHVANFCLKFKKHDSNRRHENRESFIAHFISCERETPFRMFENERQSNEIFGLIVDQEQYFIKF